MLAPYALVFLAFVLYPVTYGLWLARHPESYVKLFADPIFFRTLVNTIVFLLVAVSKMKRTETPLATAACSAFWMAASE